MNNRLWCYKWLCLHMAYVVGKMHLESCHTVKSSLIPTVWCVPVVFLFRNGDVNFSGERKQQQQPDAHSFWLRMAFSAMLN
jgi:hypothetical protein